MNRFRFAASLMMLMFALICGAQQSTGGSGEKQDPGQRMSQDGASAIDQHMAKLSERLDLTADQQAEIRPIVKQMMEDRQRLMQDSSLSNDQRMEKMKTLHEKAKTQASKYLSDDQKKKLDEMEAEHHSQMHGDQGGTSPKQ